MRSDPIHVDEIKTISQSCAIEIAKLLVARSMSTCSLVIDVYYALNQIAVINFPAWSSPVFTVEPRRARNAARLRDYTDYLRIVIWKNDIT